MISTVLPDVKDFSEERPRLKSNTVISAYTNGRYYYPQHRTPSIFIANPIGKGSYSVNKSNLEITDRQFTFLGPDQALEIRFKNEAPLQTLFILFEERFIDETMSYYLSSCESLLDVPDQLSSGHVWMPNVAYRLNEQIRRLTYRLQRHEVRSQEALDDVLFELVGYFMHENEAAQKQLSKINAVKRSTREELYRRLMQAVDRMNESVGESLTLEQMASEACLNKFHFLSSFKSLYGTTPLQYFRELKLQKAYIMLQQHYPVTEVCRALSFESLGSFSNLFKKRFGVTPSQVSGSR